MLKDFGSRVLLAFAVLGIAAAFIASMQPSVAARGPSGSYSLPLSPVTSGSTISPTWANTTLNDLGSELTNSLDRQGRGAMLAPLQLATGSVSLPSLTFSADIDTGLYRGGANDIRMSSGATYVQGWTSLGATFPVGLTATQTATDGTAITATGNGTGHGVTATGGATGVGVTGFGGTASGRGVEGFGTGVSEGGAFTGGTGGGHGVVGVGSPSGVTSGAGGVFTGGPTGHGVVAAAGGSTTADTNTRSAIVVGGGHLSLIGGNPTSTTSFANTLTPMNLVKAWARVSGGVGTATIAAGFNVASATMVNTDTCIRVFWQQDFSSANHGCIATSNANTPDYVLSCIATADNATVCAYSIPAANYANPGSITVMALGAQ